MARLCKTTPLALQALDDLDLRVLAEFENEWHRQHGSDDIHAGSLPFSFSDCADEVDNPSAFRRAMRHLIALGFLESPAEIQSRKGGQKRRYMLSDKWRSWKPQGNDLLRAVTLREVKSIEQRLLDGVTGALGCRPTYAEWPELMRMYPTLVFRLAELLFRRIVSADALPDDAQASSFHTAKWLHDRGHRP